MRKVTDTKMVHVTNSKAIVQDGLLKLVKSSDTSGNGGGSEPSELPSRSRMVLVHAHLLTC